MILTPLDVAVAGIREHVQTIRAEVEHEVRRHDGDRFPERAAILFDIAGDITAAVKRLCMVAEDDRAHLAAPKSEVTNA